jgi:hypothetical protein
MMYPIYLDGYSLYICTSYHRKVIPVVAHISHLKVARLIVCKLSSALSAPSLMASSTSVTDLKGKQRQPPVVQPASGNSIVINPCQRLNPVVECVRNVPKEFGDILPDYQVGRTTGVIFLRSRHLPSLSLDD